MGEKVFSNGPREGQLLGRQKSGGRFTEEINSGRRKF